MTNLKPIIDRILDEYALPWGGTHGVGHWARVLENGLRLAQATGANIEVVQLFAIFHDSRRVNEGFDDGHGERGADLASDMRGTLFSLTDADFELLYEACAAHTDGLTEADITIQTCWPIRSTEGVMELLANCPAGLYTIGDNKCLDTRNHPKTPNNALYN